MGNTEINTSKIMDEFIEAGGLHFLSPAHYRTDGIETTLVSSPAIISVAYWIQPPEDKRGPYERRRVRERLESRLTPLTEAVNREIAAEWAKRGHSLKKL